MEINHKVSAVDQAALTKLVRMPLAAESRVVTSVPLCDTTVKCNNTISDLPPTSCCPNRWRAGNAGKNLFAKETSEQPRDMNDNGA